MENLRFSIIIPTRNRFDTLKYCLKTCLKQNFDNYEIIVSDNSDEIDSNETRKVVNELNSTRIRYFKTPAILSMTANYEFALSKSTGEYILCIGDDDGILTDSLIYVDELIKEFDASVVKSPVAVYHWKTALQTPNTFELPYPVPISRIDSRSLLKKVAGFELGYFNLPMIYYSFVSRHVVNRVIAAQGSFFGNAAAIDLYSGLVVAHYTTDFILSDVPFVIAGLSGKSNGSAEQISLKTNISREHYEKTGLHEMYKTYKVPQLPSYNLQLLSLLELVKFKKNFHLDDHTFKITPKKVIVKFLSNNPVLEKIESLGLGECFLEYDIYKDDIDDIREDFFGKNLYFPYLGNNDIQIVSRTLLDPDLFSIENVFDAAVVLREIIDGYATIKPISITIPKEIIVPPPPPPSGAIHVGKTFYKRIKRAGKILLVGHE